MALRPIAIALSLLAIPAFAQVTQIPQNGTFSVGGTTITVQNGQIVGQPSARLGGVESGCSGVHVHGTFFGAADPNSGGCGHGIIVMLPSGGSSQVPARAPRCRDRRMAPARARSLRGPLRLRPQSNSR